MLGRYMCTIEYYIVHVASIAATVHVCVRKEGASILHVHMYVYLYKYMYVLSDSWVRTYLFLGVNLNLSCSCVLGVVLRELLICGSDISDGCRCVSFL